MSEAILFPRSVVQEVLCELLHSFDPHPALGRPHALVDRICAVGGYRRQKREMKDIELLYIGRRRVQADPQDMLGAEVEMDLAEQLVTDLRRRGILAPRLDKNDRESWGEWNKHAVHVASGLPIDLFAATAENYFNRLVVTTGPADLNKRIAAAARVKGWEWEVYQPGFVPLGGTWDSCPRERRTMRSEREVFEFVGLEYLPPEARK
ncbi:MAG: hypothetical protein P4L99_27980 [Chthoniobacter sp.]|nr:hypothetical protein [Chthoniobacter sp.]